MWVKLEMVISWLSCFFLSCSCRYYLSDFNELGLIVNIFISQNLSKNSTFKKFFDI